MENDYFVPKIEDIRVGYECEVDGSRLPGISDSWIKLKFKGVDKAVISYHKAKMYRTPYLTKEQIEDEGWKFKGALCSDEQCKGYVYNYQIDIEGIFYNLQQNQDYNLHVSQWSSEEGSHTLYNGYCPSINEFRYITKELLNIQ